ncbi:hypothetical protein [Mucilaginibacter gracilis]|nr:hypothetical protein [Mucilaginibacter gracilis]
MVTFKLAKWGQSGVVYPQVAELKKLESQKPPDDTEIFDKEDEPGQVVSM